MIGHAFLVLLFFGQPVAARPVNGGMDTCRSVGRVAGEDMTALFEQPERSRAIPLFHGKRLRRSDVAFGCAPHSIEVKP